MRIAVNTIDERKRIIEITVEHNGKILNFGEEKLGIADTWAASDLYVEVNAFFQTLSVEDADALFATYTQAQEIFDTAIIADLAKELTTPITNIVDNLCSIYRMREFIPTLGIVVPNKILDDFDSTTARKHRDQTYLKHEYAGLMNLMATLKCAYPIWNLYMKILDTSSKEQEIYLLLDTIRTIGATELFDTEEMERLFEFTDMVYRSKIGNNEDTSTLEGMSPDQAVTYVFASVIIEKLMRLPINIGDHNTHLITKIYHKIEQDCKSLPTKFQAKVIRREEVRNASEDSKINWLDIFTTKQKVPSSYYILNSLYLEDYHDIHQRLDPTIPVELIEECLAGFSVFADRAILGGHHKIPLHQVMVQWMHSEWVQVHSVPHIDRVSILNAMAVSQAYLIHNGLLAAARLFSIYPISEEVSLTPMVHISKALQAELTQYCRFNHSTKASDTARLSNPFVVSIECLTSRMSEYQWRLIATDQMRRTLRCAPGCRPIDQEIKNELATMFLKLMESKYARSVS